MSDSVKRFSDRAENYARFRPNYPPAVLELLKNECGLSESSVIADVGSGTGILTEHFLRNGNQVFGVEPNGAMRRIAEVQLKRFSNFVSVDASAESTSLQGASVDFVIAAQAFHWFDRAEAKREFKRILRPGGWVVLIWNERKLDSTPFLREYEDLLLCYGTDYEKVRHEKIADEIGGFFAPQSYQLKSFENFQYFNYESLEGRVRSSSYTPTPDHPSFEPMLTDLKRIFAEHEAEGTVTFEYQTQVFYGHLG